MGYKAPAIHGNCYSVDCDCKTNHFPEFRKAKSHCLKCEKAARVYYNSPYAPSRLVYDKSSD